MRFIQAVMLLFVGLLLLPVAFVLLFLQGGIIPMVISILFFALSITFLAFSTKHIVTKDMLKEAWFWIILVVALFVLAATLIVF